MPVISTIARGFATFDHWHVLTRATPRPPEDWPEVTPQLAATPVPLDKPLPVLIQ